MPLIPNRSVRGVTVDSEEGEGAIKLELAVDEPLALLMADKESVGHMR